MRHKNQLIVGLDIGTTKICAIVGEIKEEGNIDIIGVGCHPAYGIRKGVVINVEDTVNTIKRAVEEAEEMAGCEIRSVYASISGTHIQSINSQGVIALKHREVTKGDIKKVMEMAKTISLPPETEIIDVLPQEFIVDDHAGIKDPIGVAGVRLEVRVHVITASVSCIQTLMKCIQRAGLDVIDIILQPLAASEAVLTKEEKELGVGLIDFGGGTTDLIIFVNDSIRYITLLGLGGNNITNDIAFGLRTSISEAEEIKLKQGLASIALLEKDEEIEVPTVGDHKVRWVSKSLLVKIIQARVREIFSLLEQEWIKAELVKDVLAGGIVITGGSSLLPGLIEEAEQVFDLPSRIGYPQGVGGLDIIRNPIYATGVGLVKYGLKSQRPLFRQKGGLLSRFVTGIGNWFKKAF
ncbi:MAG: cell division protein FtsA [Deltaproteobacteria bacterium]|nr:cell division protein FtsA [Deltaproteobacteria bacterium]